MSIDCISIHEMAKLLDVSWSRVQSFIQDGVIPATKFGSNYMISKEDAMRFAESYTKSNRGRPRLIEGKHIVTIGCSIDAEIRYKIERMAAKEKISISELVRRLIAKGMEEYKWAD